MLSQASHFILISVDAKQKSLTPKSQTSLRTKGGSPIASIFKTKNPAIADRVLYSRRDLNPHAQKGTGF